MKTLRTYDQIIPYLTPQAMEALEDLKRAGIQDRDLALTILENYLPDEAIYDLDAEEN